jgi:hypothetical protein
MMTSWVEQEMQSLNLGDKRRNKRAVDLLCAMAKQPNASIPVACGSQAETKGAYRHLNLNINSQEWLAPHSARTAERAAEHPYVLALSDTTELDFTGLSSLEGAGPIDGAHCRGLKVHSVLAVSPEGVPLGLLDQQVWAREETEGEEAGGKKKTRRKRAPDDKESWKWRTGAEACQERLPEQFPFVYVGDREADCYSLLGMPRRAGMDLLVRATHNRKLKDPEYSYLIEAVEAAPVLGRLRLTLRRSKKREEREAVLEIRSARVVLNKPRNGTNGKGLAPVEVSVVLAREVEETAGRNERVEWLLLSTREARTLEEAIWCVKSYALRWRVERFHYTLKSGCGIEKLQLETAERMKRALVLYSIIAWRLLHMTYYVRAEPNAPCTHVLEEDEWKALSLIRPGRKKAGPLQPLTMKEAVRQIASLGGFMGRKGDGDPGVKSIWTGFRRLMDITHGYRAAARDLGNG